MTAWILTGDVLFKMQENGVLEVENTAGVRSAVSCEEIAALRMLRHHWRARTFARVESDAVLQQLRRWGLSADEGLLRDLARKGLIADRDRPLDLEARRTAPLFFVHCPRSGSNMLRWLLDAHPRITCPPFSMLLHVLGERALLDPGSAAAYRAIRSPRPWTLRFFRDWFEEVLDQYTKREGKARWCFRHWVTYRSLHLVDEMFNEKALYVFLVRHGLDVADAASKVYPGAETWQEGPNGSEEHFHERYGGSAQMGYAHYWREVGERMLEFREQHPNRVFTLLYEDLVANPQQKLSELFGFFGEELPSELVTRAFAGNKPMLPAWEGHEVTRTKSIESGRHRLYESWSPELIRAAGAIVNDTLEAWGYERIPLESPPSKKMAAKDAPAGEPRRRFSARDLPLKQAPLNPNPKRWWIGA